MVIKKKQSIDDRKIKRVIKITLEELSGIKKIFPQQKINLSIAKVDKKEIKRLNKQYRNDNRVTDVLSFCYENNKEYLEGEIVICMEVIKNNASLDGLSFQQELFKNIIHSILHIVGYKHSSKMFALQSKILTKILLNK